jgi:hypothetical protein
MHAAGPLLIQALQADLGCCSERHADDQRIGRLALVWNA